MKYRNSMMRSSFAPKRTRASQSNRYGPTCQNCSVRLECNRACSRSLNWRRGDRKTMKTRRHEESIRLKAIQLDAKQTTALLLRKQQNSLWPEDKENDASMWSNLRVGDYGMAS